MKDYVWSPLAIVVMLAFVGVLGLATGHVWLVPSLGPSAYLVAMDPGNPQSRVSNVVLGHVLGLGAGLLGVLLVGAAGAPSALDGTLAAVRVAATVVGVLALVIACLVTGVSHAPAATTTLLVTLGAVTTRQQSLDLLIGVVLLGAIGAVARQLLLARVPVDPIDDRL